MTNSESVDADKGQVDTSGSGELDQLKQQLEYYKGEAKKAFTDRDEAKKTAQALQEQLKAPKAANKDDLTALVEDLQRQVAERDHKLTAIEQDRIRERKLGSLKEAAKRSGLKERYFDRLDRFVNLDDIDPEKAITVKIALDGLKSNMPDVFDVDTSKDFPAPRLRTDSTNDALKAELEAEMAKPAGQRSYQRMLDLQKQLKQ